jgi:hypothetical protein
MLFRRARDPENPAEDGLGGEEWPPEADKRMQPEGQIERLQQVIPQL